MFFSKSAEQKLKDIVTWARSLKINLPAKADDVKNITRLDLRFKDISKLPEEIGCLENLTELNLSNNKLKQLPKALKQLQNLHSLNLGYNNFTEIPDSICHLTQLEVLNMQANMIKSIPTAIENLSNLSTLNLFANQISVLPIEFCSLHKLSRLNMALNKLSKLPDKFENLVNIVELELWLNKFELIPDVVSKLPQLKDLYNSFDTEKLNKALIMAVLSNNFLLAEKLVFYGANVNFKMENFGSQLFTTPLFEAKSVEMMDLLLKNGADPYLEREIIKYVQSKDGEQQIKSSGRFESVLTIEHSANITNYLKKLNIQPGERTTNEKADDDIF